MRQVQRPLPDVVLVRPASKSLLLRLEKELLEQVRVPMLIIVLRPQIFLFQQEHERKSRVLNH